MSAVLAAAIVTPSLVAAVPASAATRATPGTPPGGHPRTAASVSPRPSLERQVGLALDTARPSGPRAAVNAAVSNGPRASFELSPAVHRFLAHDLGLSLPAGDHVEGVKYENWVVSEVNAPRVNFGLPHGLQPPVLGRTQLVDDLGSDTLTVSSTSSRGTAASIALTIPHAATSAATAVSGVFEMPSVPVLGGDVALRGPITFVQGAASLAGTAYDTAATSLGDQIKIDGGLKVDYRSGSGFAVSGTAVLGRTKHAIKVAVDGAIDDTSEWTLRASGAERGDPLTVAKGLIVQGGYAGELTATRGDATFTVTSREVEGWSPLPNTTQRVVGVVYSDAVPQAGAAVPSGTPAGGAWIQTTGTFAVSAGVAGTLQATGSIGFDLSSNRAHLRASATDSLDLPGAAGVTRLSDIALAGDLTVGATRLHGSVTGAGTATYDGPTSRPALLALSDSGVLTAVLNGTDEAWSSSYEPARVSSAGPTFDGGTDTTGTEVSTTGTKGTFTVSTAVLNYLTQTLGIPLGSSTTLTGSLANQRLTINAGPPAAVVITLPSGVAKLTLGASKVVINITTQDLTVAATAAAGAETAKLSVNVPAAATSTVSKTSGVAATLTVDGVTLFGTSLDFSGKLPLSGSPLAYSLKGALPSGTSPLSGVTFVSGTDTLSSLGALAVSGPIGVGSGATALVLQAAGTVKSLTSWTLRVTDPNAPSWQPIAGLVVQPDFTGTIALSSVGPTISLSTTPAAGSVTWIPGANTSIAVSGLTISNATPPAGVSCNGLPSGGIWIGVAGNVTYSVLNASAITLPGQGCVALGSTVYTTATKPTGSLSFGSPLFSIGQTQLIVSGDTASQTFSVTGTATVTIGSSPSIQISIDFSSTGALIAGIGITDLSTLGVPGLAGAGALWVSTEDIPVFDPTTMPGLPYAAAFHLRQGLSVTFTYDVPSTLVTQLQEFGIPMPSTIQAVAALSSEGFTLELDLGFGSGTNGLVLFSSDLTNPHDPNAVQLYLNDVTIAITLGADPTIELDGISTLYVPAITGNSASSPTTLMVSLSGTFALDSGNLTVGLALSGSCGGSSCPWQNAFGIQGLTIGTFAASVGIDFESAIPTPTFAFSLDGVILPQVIAGPIGLQPSATISIDVVFDATAPIVNMQLTAAPGSPALLPLEITGQPSIENAIVVNQAGLFFAPIGGTLANGTTVAPGISVDFNAVIAGVAVQIYAQDTPATLTVSAFIQVTPFNIGPLTFGGPGEPPVYLNLSISPAGFLFEFEGSFSATGLSFDAAITLTAVATFGGASLSLSITAGLPSFLELTGSLNGSISLDIAGDFSASASGNGAVVVGGTTLGSAYFAWSYSAGGVWSDVTAAANAVAQAFESAYGWADSTVTYYLNQLSYGVNQIASALQSAFSALSPTQIAQDLDGYVTSSQDAIALALQSIGDTYDQIAQAVQNVWSEGEQDVSNVLSSIGADAWASLNALNSVFTSSWNGTYYLSVIPQGGGISGFPLFMDVSGGSTSAGASVIDYPWDGGANQHWYFQDVGNGYAEIVNENSGMCLSAPGGDYNAGDALTQWYCNGSPEEAWYMDVAQNNLLGPSVFIFNEFNGYVVDAAGASWTSTYLDQWPVNYNWNQEWTITPGLF